MNNIFTAKVLVMVLLGLSAVGNASAQFPDLTILEDYPNPFGISCGIDGKETATANKKQWNQLKNRFNIGNSIEEIKFADILKLRPFKNGKMPLVTNANHDRYVSFVGYVRSVFAGGTTGESCNCGANTKLQADAHIEVVLNPLTDVNDQTGKGIIVVETTERSRRLANLGLLQTNVGNDWSTSILKSRIQGRWVKFTGWLYYDDEHHLESWRVDPNNVVGKNNWRATAWEVHPVLGIETLDGKPNDVP
jgi:hypothetical protein